MILEDYSQLAIAAALVFADDFKKGRDSKKMVDLLRHTTLNTLLSDKRKFGTQYGEIVMAVDGRNYWRKQEFPQYKAHRKANREESDTDWNSVYDIMSQLRQEFTEIFPYRFVLNDEAEADDVIAVLTKWAQTNETTRAGVFDDEPQPILIKSSDGDYGQLHKYSGVRQWNPMMKKYVKKPEKHFLLNKILRGDKGDGIPNIRSTDDQLVKGIRQPAINAKLIADTIAQVEAGKIPYFKEAIMNKGFERNRKLIDFDYIPQHITDKIVSIYNESKPVKDKSKIFNYFVQHRCRLLMEHITEF